jgi:predicted RNA binding protein YcfA (HicA-like mRNA interferase family)
MFGSPADPDAGRVVILSQKGSHIKLRHDAKPGIIVFPNHGIAELGKGLEKKLFKQAGIIR